MSGFDKETGIFDLNWSKINRYISHRVDYDQYYDNPNNIEELLKSSGYTYLGKTAYGFKIVANDAQVWTLLSGKESSFGDSSEDPEIIYNKHLISKLWFNATEIGKECKPKISAVKVNKKLEELGYIKRKDSGWIPNKGSSNGLVKKRSSASLYNDKPCVLYHRDLISILS